ncbi:MAG TPA: GNAT family N-acetyltransferase [Flavisolibacter sp.]|jgi:RsiW-degrading membrane proteinase PrsW (M82 family)/ribosomal protein S18 acetylase RimI-like enzyme|nr:GNAT family N-acetyltransferase [Flavisolibacter sp.]
MLLVALSIAPGLAICIYIFYRDIHNREPASNLIMSFIWGMLSTIPAIILEMSADRFKYESILGIVLSTFFFIALVEEFCKFIPLRFYSFKRKSFDEPLDGIVYSIMVSMGFATVENIAYVILNQDSGYSVGFMRMFTSVPAHACFAIIMGYYIGKAKFDFLNRRSLLLKGVLGATLAHGTYDSFLFLNGSTVVKHYLSENDAALIFFSGAVFFLYICLRLCRKLIHLHIAASRQHFNNKSVLSIKHASVDDVMLIRQLALAIWPQTYASILTPAQIDYMLAQMYSIEALSQQIENNNQFIITYRDGEPVGFASYSEFAPSSYKLHKLYVLASQQGRGTGRFIIDQVINDIKPKQARMLQLNVNRNNKARIFYEKLGFKIIRNEDINIGEGFFMNDYVMEKQLTTN